MPTKQMKIYVQFPTFDQQSEEIKSLINFFMENASVFFRGEYDANDVLESYTGELRFNNHPLLDSYADYAPYEIVIPYQNYFPVDFPVFSPAPQPSLTDSGLPYVGQSSIPVKDGIIDFTVSALTPVKTAFNFYQGGYDDDGGSYFATSQFIETNTISIPVRIIPKIGDNENTSTKLRPKDIVDHHMNIDGLYLQSIPVEGIFDSNGDPIAEGFVYDFQLRTESFGLLDESILGSSVEEVFYKVGITRLDTSVSMDTILTVLKTASLTLENITPGSGVAYVRFSLLDSSDHNISPSYRLCPEVNTIEQHIGTGNINGIATKAIMALQDGTYAIKALIYIKLYKANGSVYTKVISDGDFSLYDMEDTTSSVGTLYLDLTDQNIPPEPEPPSHPNILYFTSNGSEETQDTEIQDYGTPIPTYWDDGSLTTGGYSNDIVLGTPCLMDGTPVSMGYNELVLSEGSNGTIEITVHGSEPVTAGYVPFTRS